MANTRNISRVELVVGNVVHFYGARFEIISTRLVPEEQFGKPDGNGDTMVAMGKWLDGTIEPGYFGPGKDFNFQGNKLASVTIEVPPVPAGVIAETGSQLVRESLSEFVYTDTDGAPRRP